MIDALSSALVATARTKVLDRRATIKTYIAFAETYSILWLEIASQKIKKINEKWNEFILVFEMAEQICIVSQFIINYLKIFVVRRLIP